MDAVRVERDQRVGIGGRDDPERIDARDLPGIAPGFASLETQTPASFENEDW